MSGFCLVVEFHRWVSATNKATLATFIKTYGFQWNAWFFLYFAPYLNFLTLISNFSLVIFFFYLILLERSYIFVRICLVFHKAKCVFRFWTECKLIQKSRSGIFLQLRIAKHNIYLFIINFYFPKKIYIIN